MSFSSFPSPPFAFRLIPPVLIRTHHLISKREDLILIHKLKKTCSKMGTKRTRRETMITRRNISIMVKMTTTTILVEEGEMVEVMVSIVLLSYLLDSQKLMRRTAILFTDGGIMD